MRTVAPDDEGGVGSIIGGLGEIINGVTDVVSYWSDPWGNTFKALQGAASGLSKDVLPVITQATLPDLSSDWFLNAYRISFASAIFVAVLLLIPQAIRTARGHQAGRDLVESVGIYFGTFLVGAMFGPAFGMLLVEFFHSLSTVFVGWGVEGSIDGIVAEFQAMINDADPVGIAGGAPIAVLLMLCMLIGLFLVLLMLIVQLITLYFTGVLLPLGLVWVIDPTKRSFGMKLVSIWVGILAAHPLLFFLLGISFTMMANSVGAFGNNLTLQSLVKLLVAVIALFIAALSPLLLLKFAPVIPVGFGGTTGPSFSGSTIGPQNMTEATNRFSSRGSGRSGTRGSSVGAEAAPPPSPAPATGGSLSEAAAARAGTGGVGGATAAEAGSAAASGGVDVGGIATGAATAATAGRVAVVAGAAESSTGAGAAIGVPTLVAAAGILAAGKGLKLTEVAGQQAAGNMDDAGGKGA